MRRHAHSRIMATLARSALDAALKSRSRSTPVYYFHGDDDFLKDGARARPGRRGGRSGDARLQRRDAPRRRPRRRDARLACSARRRCSPSGALVVVRDVGALKKDARAALDRYLARPASDTVLVLVAPGRREGRTRRSSTARRRSSSRRFAGPSCAKWIAQHAKRELGVEHRDRRRRPAPAARSATTCSSSPGSSTSSRATRSARARRRREARRRSTRTR